MVAALSGGEGFGGASSIPTAQRLQGSAAVSGLTGGEGASFAGGEGGPQSSASISGAGQLLSNLQQLQSQNPTKFTQVVTQIANQLQTAAQQTQGSQSTFLSSLAAKFQSVANGGSLSQLQPQQEQLPAQQAYSQSGHSQSPSVVGLAQQGGAQASGNSTLQQLFTAISSEVSSALAG